MIDLKRNSKKEPVKATGLRTRASSSYSPNQKEDFKISRGRFSKKSKLPLFLIGLLINYSLRIFWS